MHLLLLPAHLGEVAFSGARVTATMFSSTIATLLCLLCMRLFGFILFLFVFLLLASYSVCRRTGRYRLHGCHLGLGCLLSLRELYDFGQGERISFVDGVSSNFLELDAKD